MPDLLSASANSGTTEHSRDHFSTLVFGDSGYPGVLYEYQNKELPIGQFVSMTKTKGGVNKHQGVLRRMRILEVAR